MKKLLKYLLLLPLIGGAFAFTSHGKETKPVEAAQTDTYPRAGSSGTIFYASGFHSDDCGVALYCYNSESDNAWSERYDYISYGSYTRVMIPYQNGNAKTWSYFIVCSYYKDRNPYVDGWSGVKKQSVNIPFSQFLNAANVIYPSGTEGGKYTVGTTYNPYYGIKSEEHIYLDLSNFTDWDKDGAKFALYFSHPSSRNSDGWSQANNIGDSYFNSFLWKVNGQTNDHLYEGIVPKQYGVETIWNSVKAIRYASDAYEPGNGTVWNESQELHFTNENHNLNLIGIDNWGHGEFTTSISRADRVEYYGRYFLDTVQCSGHGNSDVTTSGQWDALKDEYVYHLDRNYQGDVWKTVADKSGSLIAQAMARYDYIVLYKQYDHEDFINRAESPNKTVYSSEAYAGIQPYTTDKKSVIYIVVIAVVSISSVGLLIVTKRKKALK